MSNSDIQERKYYSLCKRYKLLEKLLDVGPDATLIKEIKKVEEELRKDFSDYQNNPTWPLDEQVKEDLDLPPLADDELKQISIFAKSVVG